MSRRARVGVTLGFDACRWEETRSSCIFAIQSPQIQEEHGGACGDWIEGGAHRSRCWGRQESFVNTSSAAHLIRPRAAPTVDDVPVMYPRNHSGEPAQRLAVRGAADRQGARERCPKRGSLELLLTMTRHLEVEPEAPELGARNFPWELKVVQPSFGRGCRLSLCL